MATSVTSKSLSGFDPRSTIPGCVLWIDASQELGSNGTYMNTITDRSPSGYSITATTSNTITLATNYRNGLPVYNFGYNRAVVSNFNWNVSFTVFFVTQFNYANFLYAQWDPAGPGYTNYVFPGNWALVDIGPFAVYDSAIQQKSVTGPVWNIFCLGYSAGATTFYPYSVNGAIRTTLSGSGTTTTNSGPYPLYLNGNGNGANDVGYIAEIIHYNQNLTVAQAQQVEGYLAAKWGIPINTFAPNAIPGCLLWLDASDSNYVVKSGSNVTALNDKSGNGINMNQTTPTAINASGSAVSPVTGTPINGLSTAYFAQQAGLKQGTEYNGVTNVFWVGRQELVGNDSEFLFGDDNNYDWHADGSHYINTTYGQGGILNSTARLYANGSVTSNTFSNITVPSNGTLFILSVNGITGNTRFQGICYDRIYNPGWNGDFGECIVYTTALSTLQISQVEAYLSKKWSISIGSNVVTPKHPYYPIRPFSRVFQPTDIGNCILWFDAADSSTITLSNSYVTAWTEKSGYGGYLNTTTGSSYYCAYSSNGLNNLPTITTGTASTSGRLAGYFGTVPSSSNYTIFIVWNFNSINGYNSRLFGFAPGSSADYQSGFDFQANGTNNPVVYYSLDNSSGATISYNSFYNTGPMILTITQTVTSSIALGSFGFGTPNFQPNANGNITGANWSEMLVYNTALTTAQQQQIQGYLGWKWGLINQLSTFSPTQISGCTLWLDATDSSTVGFLVTNGSFEADNVSGSNGSGQFNYQTPTGWSTSGTPVIIYNSTGSYNSSWGIQAYSGNNCIGLQGTVIIYQTVNVTSGHLYTLTWYENSRPGVSPNDLKVSVNSTVVYYQNPVSHTGIYSSNWLKKQSTPWYASSSSVVIKFETTNPLGSDCTTFLDYIMVSSVGGSDTITSWLDKSGNGNIATGNGTPVLSNASLNGYQSIYTNNGPYFTGPISITGSTFTCFAVATTTSSLPRSGHDQRLVSLENGSNVDYGRTDSAIALMNQGGTSSIETYRLDHVALSAITTNVPFIAVSEYDGTNGYLWKNGSTGSLASSSSTGTFAVTKYGIGNQANNSGEYWIGYIGEVIVYNTALTTTQRQQVESYLSKKWGISVANYLAATNHPYRTLPPSSVRDTTAAIPTVFLQALGYSGSGTWYDKSPNGFNATLENGTAAKNTAGNGIVLNGSTNWTFSTISAGSKWSIAVWYKNTGNPVGSVPCILTQNYGPSAINITLGYTPSLNVAFFDGSSWRAGTTITFTNNVWTHVIGTWDGTTMSTYINGSLLGSTTPGSASSDGGTAYRIGRRWDYPDYMVGEIGEVVIYKQLVLTKAQIYNEYISRAYIYSY